MKREPVPLTARQTWDKDSNEWQDNVNETLADLSPVIASANVALAQLYATNSEEIEEYAINVIEFLNDKWGCYIGDRFMVTGHWHEPAVAVGNEGILSRLSYSEAFAAVTSNGFVVNPMESEDSNDPPKVGMSFSVGCFPFSSPSMKGIFELLTFAEPHEISLQYLRPGTSEVISADVNEIGDAIMRADALLHLYTSHPNSTFFKQSAKKQTEFFRSILNTVEITLPRADTLDEACIHDAVTEAIYYKDNGELVKEYPRNTETRGITGRIIGVALPDMWQSPVEQKYTNPYDLQCAETGLCLIVDSHNLNLSSQNDQILIPYRAIDNFGLSVR